MKNVLIVGAGFAGAVVARELADKDFRITVVDRRDHIGGNAYDCNDKYGVLVHKYGPHIFHTNSDRIIRWLSRFTDWHFYEHRVLASIEGNLYPIPINRQTINRLYKLDLSEDEVEEYLNSVRETKDAIESSEDVVLSSVGQDLCEKFFKNYTKKQWGLDLKELSAGVAARIPTRTNDDDRYFTDRYQFMPIDGYTELFIKILSHENISTLLSVSFDKKMEADYDVIVYTGKIDEYFDFLYGKLPYRSLEFKHVHNSMINKLQETGTINYPNDYDYTRVTEFKHLTGQVIDGTSYVFEYPKAEGDAYYPIPRPENSELYERYKSLAEKLPNHYFVGRLAQYKYLNMDQVIGAAIETSNKIISRYNNDA